MVAGLPEADSGPSRIHPVRHPAVVHHIHRRHYEVAAIVREAGGNGLDVVDIDVCGP